MAKTKIEWADEVWNPTVGCTRVSAGCQNCYAERMARRMEAMGAVQYKGLLTADGRWNGTVRTIGERLRDPLKWKKPRRVFVDSMSDLFHEDVPFEFIDEVFHTMRVADQHTYMILTKRPVRMMEFIHWQIENTLAADKLWSEAHQNVWLGVSVEDQHMAARRISILLRTPAKVKFISAEPLLGPLNLMHWLMKCPVCGDYFGCEGWEDAGRWRWNGERWEHHHGYPAGHIETVPAPLLNWVICGGESGPGARPMHPDWARSLRDQCQTAGVPFFFKQWGEWKPVERQHPQLSSMAAKGEVPIEGNVSIWVGKKAAGNLLDGRVWEERP